MANFLRKQTIFKTGNNRGTLLACPCSCTCNCTVSSSSQNGGTTNAKNNHPVTTPPADASSASF